MIAADPVAGFRAAMAEAGLHTAAVVVADGELHRFHVEGDRRGTRNGWCVLYPDNPPAGAFGSWKASTSATWCAAGGQQLNEAELRRFRERMAEARRARDVEQRQRHGEARRRARELWSTATPARAAHPYLTRKNVTPGTARQRGERLVLPVTDLDGELRTLQFIDAAGGKLLLRGGRKRGHFIPVHGAMPGASRILVCEGFATGRTLAGMEPAALVLAAVDAGNLKPVAVAVRERWPHAELVVCCDADADGIGIAKGRDAAVAAAALVAIPEFPEGVAGTDFNDLVNAAKVAA